MLGQRVFILNQLSSSRELYPVCFGQRAIPSQVENKEEVIGQKNSYDMVLL